MFTLHRPAHVMHAGVLLLALTLVTAGTAGFSASAQAQMQMPGTGAAAPSSNPAPGAANGQGASKQDLKQLLSTLKNDKARKEFVRNLEGLLKAQRARDKQASSSGPDLSARVAQFAANQVQRVSDRMAQVLGVVRLAPKLVGWAEGQVTIVAKRDRLIGFLWRFLVIVGIGMGAQYVFRRVTNPARRRLEAVPPEEAMIARAARFVGRTLMLFLNALSYGAGAYAAYVALPMKGQASAILLVGASSFFAAKLILATTRVVLSPGVPGLRLGDMGDETAQYLYLWARRLVRIFVYAFFLLEAVGIAGLPKPAHDSLMYILGLALVGFLIVFVLQNRHTVAVAIRGVGRASLVGARARIAALWHIAVIAYIIAVYLVWLFRVPGGFEFLMAATGWTVAIAIIARVAVLIAHRGLDRIMRISPDLAKQFPGLEERANRYMPVFRSIIRWTTFVVAVLFVLDAWGMDTLGWLASAEGRKLIQKLFIIVFIVAVAFVVWEGLSLLIARYLDRLDDGQTGAARARTLLPLARTSVAIVLVVLVSLIVLSEIGVNIGPLLAGAGVVGIAVGFGAQKLVQDVITGLFMLIEDTLAVGDVVQFDADHAGVVEKLTIRTVRLRDLSGNVHVLPFSEVHTVLNMTKGFAYYLLDVGVAYREDIDRVIDVLRDLGAEMEKDEEYGQYIVAPIEILGLDKFGDSAIVVRARLKIEPPIKRWYVGREFNRRMKARFDKEGIEIPFPHRTIYFGEDQKGNAPPLRVANVDEAPGRGGDANGKKGRGAKDGDSTRRGPDERGSDAPSPSTQD